MTKQSAAPRSTRAPSGGRIALSLALQGGGAQGAFTWGVLERLLDEEHIDIVRISGSSAGALNGAALATGLARGGRAGARAHLQMLWEQVAQAGWLMTFLMMPLRKPGMGLWDDALPLLSPHQANPLGMAPLRSILASVVDADLLRAAGDPATQAGPGAPALYVNAVHVPTGAERVFGPRDIGIEALLASACAPLSYPPVVIDGEPYWDGSYAGNPPLWPLYQGRQGAGGGDILLVELTPLRRAEVPLSAKNILNRINEVASVQGLVAEMRALAAANQAPAPRDALRLHVLSMAEQASGPLAEEPSIKRTVGRVLFEMLRQEGRRACDAWLAAHGRDLGRVASVDIEARYLRPYAPQLQPQSTTQPHAQPAPA